MVIRVYMLVEDAYFGERVSKENAAWSKSGRRRYQTSLRLEQSEGTVNKLAHNKQQNLSPLILNIHVAHQKARTNQSSDMLTVSSMTQCEIPEMLGNIAAKSENQEFDGKYAKMNVYLELEYSKSFPVEEKMMRATSASHRTESSSAFLKIPRRRFDKVTCLAAGSAIFLIWIFSLAITYISYE